MTRQEFIDDTAWFGELRDFCDDYGCSICGDVYDPEERDDYIDGHLREMVDACASWDELRRDLNNLRRDNGFEYYELCEDGSWVGLEDEDFDDYFNEVLEWGDARGIWDEEVPEPETKKVVIKTEPNEFEVEETLDILFGVSV